VTTGESRMNPVPIMAFVDDFDRATVLEAVHRAGRAIDDPRAAEPEAGGLGFFDALD
jgi:hypothetical protein